MVTSVFAGGIAFAGTAAAGQQTLVVDKVSGTDDGASPYATLDAALADMSESDTIVLKNGTYVVDDTIVLDKTNVTLTEGENASIENAALDSGTPVIKATAEGVTIKNLDITSKDSDGGNAPYEIVVAADNVKVAGNTITRTGDSGHPGIFVKDGVNANIVDNTLHGASIGAQIGGGERIDIRGNSITTSSIVTDAVWITGPGGNAVPEGADIHIRDNGGLAVRVEAGPGYLKGYHSIQDAVDAASPGERICLTTGEFVLNSPVEVDKNVTIHPFGWATPVVRNKVDANDGGQDAAFRLMAEGSTLLDLSIVTHTSVADNPVAVKVMADNVTVDGNDITRTATAGTTATFNAGIQLVDDLDGVELSNNTLAKAPIGLAGSNATVTNNTITKVAAEGIFAADGTMDGDESLVVERNVITDYNLAGGDAEAIKLMDVPTSLNGESTDNSTEAIGLLLGANDFDTAQVDGLDTDVRNVDTGAYYATIQAAVDDAAEDETIEAAGDTYDEHVTVETAGVSVVAVGDATITKGVTLAADNATVDGFTIEGADFDGVSQVVGVYVPGGANDVEIANNSIAGPGASTPSRGVLFTEAGSERATIVGNEIANWTTGTYVGTAADVTFADNHVHDNVAGLGGIEGGLVTVAGNDFERNDEAVGVGAGSVDMTGQTGLARAEKSTYVAFYSSLADAVDNAVADSTVAVQDGEYDGDFTVSTTNLTIASVGGAPENVVVNGTIEVTAADVTVTGVTVTKPDGVGQTHGIELADADGATVDNVVVRDVASADTHATGILVNTGSENVTVADSEVYDVSSAGSGTAHGIQLWSDHDSTDDLIENVVVSGTYVHDVTGADAGAYGVQVNSYVSGVELVDNRVDDVHAGGWAAGVSLTGKSGYLPSGEEYPTKVWVHDNRIEDVTAGDHPGVGVLYEATVDVQNTTVTRNAILTPDVDVANKVDETAYAGLNWYGDARADNATIVGDVHYDPFLTAKPGDVADQNGDIQRFANDLTVPGDGEMYAVGFPGDTEGTLGDALGEFNGTVWAYDAANQQWYQPTADAKVTALSAVVVVAENDTRVVVDYADAAGPPEMDERQMYEGWNFVAAPQAGAADVAFGASSADPARIVNAFAQPGSQPVESGERFGRHTLGGSGDGPDVSPYTGYWVYANDDGSLAANAYPGLTVDDVYRLLAQDTQN